MEKERRKCFYWCPSDAHAGHVVVGGAAATAGGESGRRGPPRIPEQGLKLNYAIFNSIIMLHKSFNKVHPQLL